MDGRTTATQTVTLARHSAGSAGPIISITVRLERNGADLRLRFLVEGQVDQVRWPEPVGAGRADELWRHTCFEAFVATSDGYVEFNLSPSGQWASYRFDAPRIGMRPADEATVSPTMEVGSDRVALTGRITLPPGARRLGLSAVIEAVDGSIGYWALAHPSAKPDFHHPDSFVLDLP